MKALLILQLLAGLALIFVAPAFERAKVVAMWSDFKVFEARAGADEGGARILKYGGESPKENFEQLLDRLWNLDSPTLLRPIGLLISVTSALALFLHFRARRFDDHVIHSKL